MKAKNILKNMAQKADIRLNGDRPWDMRLNDERACDLIMRKGTLGLGESYMLGWWDCERIDEMVNKALQAHLEYKLRKNIYSVLHRAVMSMINLQGAARAPIVAERHYNADQAVFKAMLDPYMQYSCGYWKESDNLNDAQLAKMELIRKKLKLEPGMRVLDIGCGWGGLARYLAERSGVSVTGISVSTDQVNQARENAGDLPVKYELRDYRALSGKWDRVVSVGMFEHVGPRNYEIFFNTVKNCLKPEGIFLLHTIGGLGGKNYGSDPWLEKYIFPNSLLPSARQITESAAGKFVLEDWHNFGLDYDKTAIAWHGNFERGYREERFQCGERFRRMFAYYLRSCAGAFRSRNMYTWQIVLSPHGVTEGYESVR